MSRWGLRPFLFGEVGQNERIAAFAIGCPPRQVAFALIGGPIRLKRNPAPINSKTAPYPRSRPRLLSCIIDTSPLCSDA